MIRPFVGNLLLTCLLGTLFQSRVDAVEPIDFNRDVGRLLSSRCFSCHGLDDTDRKANLRLDLREGAILAAESGEVAIVPGSPKKASLSPELLRPMNQFGCLPPVRMSR